MHFVAWVVADDEEQLARIMAPYEENLTDGPNMGYCSCKDESGAKPCNGDDFCRVNKMGKWDWYVIGGRWDKWRAGSRFKAGDDLVPYPSRHSVYTTPYTFVTGEMWVEREVYKPQNPPESQFEDVPDWDGKVRAWLSQLRPEQNVYIVDYHR